MRTIRAFYRVNKTLKDILGTGSDYIKRIKEFKHQIVETIQRGKKTIGIQRGIKLFRNQSKHVQNLGHGIIFLLRTITGKALQFSLPTTINRSSLKSSILPGLDAG